MIQERAKKNQEVRKGEQAGATYQELGKLNQVHTNKELGKIAGVSDETIRKYFYCAWENVINIDSSIRAYKRF